MRQAIEGRYNGDPFQRVIYSESHDEIANGKARVASEINPQNPDCWAAQKRTTLAAALVLTSPGIPMLFQGQEFLEDGWFQDSVPLDWHKSEEFSGLVRMYRDLIHLRLNRFGSTRGLTGSGVNTFHQNQADNVIAYHRWHQGGPGDDVVVVVNLSHNAHGNYQIGFPSPGLWRLRLNSDWIGYSRAFGNQACSDVNAGARRSDQSQDQNNAPRDGSVIAAHYNDAVTTTALYGHKNARFNPVEFGWLGSDGCYYGKDPGTNLAPNQWTRTCFNLANGFASQDTVLLLDPPLALDVINNHRSRRRAA